MTTDRLCHHGGACPAAFDCEVLGCPLDHQATEDEIAADIMARRERNRERDDG